MSKLYSNMIYCYYYNIKRYIKALTGLGGEGAVLTPPPLTRNCPPVPTPYILSI